jgi:hypothetical protein
MFEVIEFSPVYVSITKDKHDNKDCPICHKTFIETPELSKKIVIKDTKSIHTACLAKFN